jgi:hypothetical protein
MEKRNAVSKWNAGAWSNFVKVYAFEDEEKRNS